MAASHVERKLAAIFAADIAGYSRLMARDEVGTLARLKASRAIVDGLIAAHRGRIFNTAGDSVVADFASAVDAVQCAVATQAALSETAAEDGAEDRLAFRIGVHVGDVIVDGTNLLGDGVNIAARLEALAEPGGICLSAATREQIANKLPLGFDDLGEQQFKNIPHAVRAYRVKSEGATASAAADAFGAPPLPDKPSVAVLPFHNMSGDPEQEYFVDGMVEEIITALSRIRWLFVIARNSTFTYKGQAVDARRVGRELGVRYVLEGSVRKGGNRVRITAQLIEAETGAHLWADRFDGGLDDVFELQDQVATSVAGVIEPALQAAETIRAARRPTSDLTAYDLYLRAYALFFASARQIPAALALVERAIERDPYYGPALAWAGVCCFRQLFDARSEDREADSLKGAEFARRALEVASDDPAVLANAAGTLTYLGEDAGAMMALVDRALILNPNYARGWHVSGYIRLWAGDPDTAIQHCERSMQLSPRARVGTSLTVIGGAHFYARRYDQAAAPLLLAIQEDPSYPAPYLNLAAAYAHSGRLDEAREIIRRLHAISPIAIPDASYLRNENHRQMLLSGLRLAAGEADPPDSHAPAASSQPAKMA